MPAISYVGAPSLAFLDNFFVGATNVLNEKIGFLMWGLDNDIKPFGGGYFCLEQRPFLPATELQYSGGNPAPPDDCSGTYSFQFTNDYLLGNGLVVGTAVYAQYWSRDPGYSPPNNIGLTDALEFVVCP